MSAIITIENFSLANLKEQGALNADAAVGATALTFKNNQGFAATDLILVGLPGADGSEILTISAVNADQVGVTVGATKLKHLQNEPVYKLTGSQAKIYRAPNTTGLEPIDANFTLLSTVTIEPDQPSTKYIDAAGSDSYWYKYTYYNPTSTAETDRIQSPAARGQGDADGNYTTVDLIRGEAGFRNAAYITDALIDEKRQAAQAEVNSALSGYYAVPFTQPVNAFIADITMRLAAGLLMVAQYGAYDTGNKKLGQDKIDEARKDYKDLQGGSKTLVDTNGGSTAIGTTDGNNIGGFGGWPNQTTITTGQQYDTTTGKAIAGSGDFLFRADDKY